MCLGDVVGIRQRRSRALLNTSLTANCKPSHSQDLEFATNSALLSHKQLTWPSGLDSSLSLNGEAYSLILTLNTRRRNFAILFASAAPRYSFARRLDTSFGPEFSVGSRAKYQSSVRIFTVTSFPGGFFFFVFSLFFLCFFLWSL